MSKAANELYDQLLRGDHFASTCDAFARAADDPSLAYKGRLTIDVLRPFFLPTAHYRRLQATTNKMIAAMVIAVRAVRSDPAMQKICGVTSRMLEVSRPDHSPYGPLWQRLDGFIGADGELRFIEVNPAPGAALQNNLISHFYAQLPIMQKLRERHNARPVHVLPHILESVRPTQPAPGEYRTANLALVITPGAPTNTDAFLSAIVDDPELTKAMFARNGGKVLSGTLDEFSFHNGRLVLHGEAVDLLFTGGIGQLLRAGETHATHRAMKAGAARLMSDPFWSYVTGEKSFFELLTDEVYAPLFGEETFKFLADHVPWTRVVTDRKTTYAGRTIELLPFILENQSKLVLKPSSGAKAVGVVLGWACSPADWKAALAHCAAEKYVVQERIVSHEIEHPINKDGSLEYVSRTTDFNPYVWENAGADGAVIRMSSSGITNVGAGATKTALFLVD